MKNLILLVLGVVFISICSYGQIKQIGEINKGLEYHKKMLTFYSEQDSIFFYSKRAYELLNQSKYENKAAISLLYMALSKYYLGEHRCSKNYALKLIKDYSSKKNIRIDLIPTALNLTSIYYRWIGDFSSSIKNFELAIQDYKNRKGKPAYLWTYYFNLGVALIEFNHFDKSIPLFKKSEELLLKANEGINNEYANVYIMWGKAFLKKKQTEKAKKYITKGLKYLDYTFEQYDEQLKLIAYQSLSELYLEQNNLDSTNFYLNKINEVRQRHGDNFQYAYNSYILEGKLEAIKGNLEKADSAYQTAIQVAKERFKDFDKSAEAALMHLEKARFYQEYKSLSAALPIYQDALIENSHTFNDTKWINNPDYTTFLNPANGLDIWLGKVGLLHDLYFETKEEKYLQEAFQLATLITEFIYHIRRTYKAAEAKLYLSGKVIPFYDLAIQIAMEMKALTNETQYDEWAFKFMEANKSLLLLETLSKNKNLKSDNLDDEQIAREKELQQEIAYYRKRIIEEKQKNKADISQEDLKDWEQQAFDLKESHQLLLDTLREHYPEIYVQTPQFEQLTMKEVRNQMQKDEALISFFVGEEHLFAYLLRKDAFDIIKMDRVDSLQNQVEQLAQTLKYPPNSQTFQQEMVAFGKNAHQLYQHLLQPLLEKLPTGFFSTTVKQLTIIPDDFLFTLPFEVLVQHQSATTAAYQDLDYLCKDYHIDYQFSAFMLNGKPVQKEVKQLSFFGFAPEFGSQAIAENRSCIRDELYSLRCSQSETENINTFFNGQVLLAEKANTEAFWQALTEADILHLATHVCLDPEEQLNTRVFLSDGYITALDLTGKQFSNELTVLSACDTGAGKLVKGEGLASIAREFMMAGSKSTLTSLWSVDDCSTSQIMESYYQHLQTGMPKNEAIQKAKMNFLQTADMERAHPYYWAPFLQFGDKGGIFEAPFQLNNWYILLLVIFSMGLLSAYYLYTRKKEFKG